MISGSNKLSVHSTGGPQNEVMTVSQFRDAVGYSKQVPAPARKVTAPGIVRLAGSTVTINTTGIVDGNKVSGLDATDGLVGAAISGVGIPPNATIAEVLVPAIPGHQGTVRMSNLAPFAPTTGAIQPIVIASLVKQSAICGLATTDDLIGAAVSGPGIPAGATVSGIRTNAAAATNLEPGVPGEVLIAVPPVPVPATPKPLVGAPTPVTPAPAPTPPAAVLTPVSVAFDVPVRTIIIPDGVSVLQLSPVDPVPELTVKLPPNPVDGQVAYIYSTRAIAALTILANGGQRLNWSPAVAPAKVPTPAPAPAPWPAPTAPLAPGATPKSPSLALAADTRVGYLYSAPNATWDRIA